jgi:hypothetical protein
LSINAAMYPDFAATQSSSLVHSASLSCAMWTVAACGVRSLPYTVAAIRPGLTVIGPTCPA